MIFIVQIQHTNTLTNRDLSHFSLLTLTTKENFKLMIRRVTRHS